jgi:4-hydroxybenzoate polyprenyltransferase
MSPDMIDILRVGRVHTALATAAIPTAACIALGGGALEIILALLGAVMHHAWGFSLNEIIDLKVDSGNPDLSEKPLVSGRISKGEAHFISISFLILSIVSFSMAGFILSSSFLPLVFILIATGAGAIYDIWGKRFPLSDIFMASWMFFLVLAGSSAATTEFLVFPAIGAASLGGLQILFNNSVEGGLKDVKNDRSSGTRTLAVVLGASFDDNLLKPGNGLRIWGISLRIFYILLAASASLLIADEAEWGQWIIIVVSILGIIVFMNSLVFLGGDSRIERKNLLKIFAKHEVLSFLLFILVLMPLAGWQASIFLFTVPFLYYMIMNRIMFRTGLNPNV